MGIKMERGSSVFEYRILNMLKCTAPVLWAMSGRPGGVCCGPLRRTIISSFFHLYVWCFPRPTVSSSASGFITIDQKTPVKCCRLNELV